MIKTNCSQIVRSSFTLGLYTKQQNVLFSIRFERNGMPMTHFIEFHDVCKFYTMGENRIAAADHISFYVDEGEF